MSSLGRIAGVAGKTLSVLRHDKRTLAFIILIPLLLIIVFGYTFGGEPTDVKMAVVMEDYLDPLVANALNPYLNGTVVPALGELLVSSIDGDSIEIVNVASVSEGMRMVENGEVWGLLVISANFSVDTIVSMALGGNATIDLRLDGTNTEISAVLRGKVQQALFIALDQWAEMLGHPIPETPASLEISYVYGGDNIEFIDSLAPGIIGYAVMMVTLLITIVTLVRERNDGTLERSRASPLNPYEIVAGNAIAFGAVALVQSIVTFAAAIILFDIAVIGSVGLALVILLLHGIGHQALGMLLSAAAKNELQAIQMFPLVMFPSILLTGMLWPIESIPAFMRPLSYALPLTYTNEALKAVMLKGWGLDQIWFNMLVLVLFALITLGLSGLLLSRRN